MSSFSSDLPRGIVAAIKGGLTELWLHEDQKSGWVTGRKILDHLTTTGLLAGCADLSELEAIQAKGFNFFRKHFQDKAIFGWRGEQDDNVPFLACFDGRVLLIWRNLAELLGSENPTLLRKK